MLMQTEELERACGLDVSYVEMFGDEQADALVECWEKRPEELELFLYIGKLFGPMLIKEEFKWLLTYRIIQNQVKGDS